MVVASWWLALAQNVRRVPEVRNARELSIAACRPQLPGDATAQILDYVANKEQRDTAGHRLTTEFRAPHRVFAIVFVMLFNTVLGEELFSRAVLALVLK